MSNPYAPPDVPPTRRPDQPAPADGHGPDAASDRGAPVPGPHAGATPPGDVPPGGAVWGLPPGQAPVAAPGPHEPEPDPEATARAGRLGRTFAALLLAAVLTGTFPVPWQAAGLVFGVLALVVGVRALVVAIRGRQRGALTGMLAAGLAVSAMWIVVSLGMALMWPVQLDRQRCLAGALTISARQACEAQFEQDLDEWRTRIEDSTRP